MSFISIDNLIGKKFGRLTITKDLRIKTGRHKVLAICECGVEKEYYLYNIKRGNTNSCGCLHRELAVIQFTTHGLTDHPLYCTWDNMIDRCYKIDSREYHNYGAKGVEVCEEWKNDIMSFFNWAINNGWEKGLELDKDKLSPYKKGLLYSPEFCCFLNKRENSWFKSNSLLVEYNGETKCLGEWAYLLNVKWSLIRHRIFTRGWSVEKAFETPCMEKFRKTHGLKK